MNYWLRLYAGILDDPKVQRLQPEHFKGWVNLLCLAKEHDGLLPGIEEIAFRLRIEDAQAVELIEALKARGLLDDAEAGLIPHNWAGRQYETEETATQNGSFGNHKRWHVGRGIIAPDCHHCRGDIAPESPPNRPDASPDIAPTSPRLRPDVGANRPPNPEQSRAEADSEADSEQQQSRGRGDLPALPALPAAAADPFAEPHSSRQPFHEVEAYVLATKPHAKNPGGLARRLWRTGEEDASIENWRAGQKPREKLKSPADDFSMADWITASIERDDRAHLEMERGYIADRGGPKEPWEFRVVEYFNNQPTAEGGRPNVHEDLSGSAPDSDRGAGSEAGEPGDDLRDRSEG